MSAFLWEGVVPPVDVSAFTRIRQKGGGGKKKMNPKKTSTKQDLRLVFFFVGLARTVMPVLASSPWGCWRHVARTVLERIAEVTLGFVVVKKSSVLDAVRLNCSTRYLVRNILLFNRRELKTAA